MGIEEEQAKNTDLGTESLRSEKERIAADLDLVVRRCQALQETMQQQLFHSSLEGNRRSTSSDMQDGRRRGERREPDRAGPGRRQLADRRIPLEERLTALGHQMMQMVDLSIALTDQRRRFERAEF